MARVKIISNPYEKKISFQRFDEYNNTWNDIDSSNNPNSRLLNERLAKSFFPFSVSEIVEIIKAEYYSGDEPLEVVFEGTEDEFEDLSVICHGDFYVHSVTAVKAETRLENARDILPEIRDIFGKVSDIVEQSELSNPTVAVNCAKLEDAVSNVIPICVVGNYSSGKSTFINALIGNEILPNGDNPVTAKICRIRKSAYDNQAVIRINYDGSDVVIRFQGDNYSLDTINPDNGFIRGWEEELNNCSPKGIAEYIRTSISYINNYKDPDGEDPVSYVIDLEVPFQHGVLSKSDYQYVLYDTPGSNTATNEEHIDVLMEAINSQSNGIPIYTALFKELDTIDNEKLVNVIKDSESLDSRFTMIIINQADSANIPERPPLEQRHIKQLMSYALPRELYSAGIYFVSAIMGLGALNEGRFINAHYAETFEDKRKRFVNPKVRGYKQLYKYNIMPGQLKDKMVSDSESAENVLFANSGLYAVEKVIETFASKYSYYNKCTQANQYLCSLIEGLISEIGEEKENLETVKEVWIKKREADKADLIKTLQTTSEQINDEYYSEYMLMMAYCTDSIRSLLMVEDLRKQEQRFIKQKKKRMGYGISEGDEEKSRLQVLRRGLLGFTRGALDTNLEDIAKKEKEEFQINQAVSKHLIKQVSNYYDRKTTDCLNNLFSESKSFWTGASEEYKKTMLSMITDNTTLDDDEREKLEQIVIRFGIISYELDEEEKFRIEDYRSKIQLGSFIIHDQGRLKLGELSKSYNNYFADYRDDFSKRITAQHKDDYSRWCERLLNTLIDNIVSYSPLLKSQQAEIDANTERIEMLEHHLEDLRTYSNRISSLITWHEV